MTLSGNAALRSVLVLLAFAAGGTALLSYTFEHTKEVIAKNEEQEKLDIINQVLPSSLYDNDLLADRIVLPPTDLLGTESSTIVYRGRAKNAPAAVVLEAVAPDGYGGKIRLLMGIRYDGVITGVRVISHSESAGMGDFIDAKKTNWMAVFANKSLADPTESNWKVKQDGGIFDHMAGATITPRAVIKAVTHALKFYAEQKDILFTQPRSPDSR